MFALLVALLIPADTISTPPVAAVENQSSLFAGERGIGIDPTLIPTVAPIWVESLRLAAGDQPAGAPQIIEYSDAYLTRLKIHKYASYATLPLFAAAYITGNELIKNGGNAASWARNTHGTIAGSLAVLFGVNTVTGLWNLYDSRKDPEGKNPTHPSLRAPSGGGRWVCGNGGSGG